MATTKTTKQAAKKATKKAATKQPATKTASAKPAPVAKKTAAKTSSATKKAPAKKSVTKTATKKTAIKKVAKSATKKAVAARKPVEVKALKSTKAPAAESSLGRLKTSAKAFAAQAASTASVLSKEVTQTAAALGTTAKDKAQKSVARSKEFINQHPNEAAGLAAAGLTVAASVLGRKGAGKLVKAAVATGLATKATKVVGKASKLLNDIRSKK